MSTINQELSSHSLSLIKRVTIEVGSDEQIKDSENFQDIRMELNSTGHNLTSVLMNPRETMFEDLFDEFSFDQSAPLEYQSPFSNIDGKSNQSAISLSIHNTIKNGLSSNSNKISSDSGSSTSTYMAASMFTMTHNENEQLEAFIARMNKIFTHYERVHQHHTSTSTTVGTPYSNFNRSRSDSNSHTTMAKTTPRETPRSHGARFNHKKYVNDDLRNCYSSVPNLFFQPDFCLSNQDMYNSIFSAIDVDMIIEKMKMIRGTQVKDWGMGDATPVRSKTVEDHLMLATPTKHNTAMNGCTSSHSLSVGLSPRKHFDDPNLTILELQDQLSVYLDLVEMALLRQIYARSPSFFRTLDDIRSLQYTVSDTTKHLIHTVRGRLQAIDTSSSTHALVIPQMARRQNNMSVLADKLTYMSQVVAARTAILQLLEAEEYITALELISSTKDVYFQHSLQSISAMKAIGNQLNDYDNLVCEIMCNKFVSLAIQWEDDVMTQNTANGGSVANGGGGVHSGGAAGDHLSEMYEEFHVNTSNKKNTNGHNGNKLINDHNKTTSQTANETSLRQLLHSLVITERVQSALGMYKHRLLEAIRLIVRTCVMEYLVNFDPSIAYGDNELEESSVSENTPGGHETPFGQRVREMSDESFLSCLEMCFEHVILSLQKANVFHSFVEAELGGHIYVAGGGSSKTNSNNDLSSLSVQTKFHSSGTPDPTDQPVISPADKRTAQETLRTDMTKMSKECLKLACDLAQKSIGKLITLRKENNSKLLPALMKQLWGMALRFIVQLEEIFVSTAYVLRQCLLAQTTSFLKHIHEEYKKKLVNTLDSERFTQCDVSKERQDEINRLVTGKTFIVATQQIHAASSVSLLEELSSAKSAGSAVAGSFKAAVKDKQAKPVLVDGCEYKVVWSALLLVECVMTYLEIACHFSPVTPDVINCTDELLNLFDSRTQQLILGAQATKSAARLKSISIKHLAITGQSISLLMALIPHVRAALLAQLQTRQQMCLIKLDETSHTYSNHHNSIVEKFGSIVSDVVDQSALKLRAYNWDNRNEEPCEYFIDLRRNVTVIHTTLLAVLPVNQIQDVFSRIFTMLSRKIPQHFEEIMPLEPAGKDRIVDAVSNLMIDFARLKHLDVVILTATLEEVFKRRYKGV